jgi:MFS family permease
MIGVSISAGQSQDGDEELNIDYVADAAVKGNPYQYPSDGDDAASVGDDDLEKLHVHVADEHGKLEHYPGEDPIVGDKKHDLHLSDVEAALKADDEEAKQPVKKEHHRSVIGAGIESIKYLVSLCLLVFSVVVVMASIFESQTVGTAEKGIPSVLAFFIFWFLIVWLATMEGGQGALVGLQPVDAQRYAESHPRSLMCTLVAHKGDNMERFIVGRQFLVVLVVFVINMMGSAIKDAQVLGMSGVLAEIFVSTGVSLMLVAIMIGQLTAQVNATNCMLDFINNYFMLFTTYVSLAIEFSGILHSVYLVQIIFSKVAGQAIDTKEEPRNGVQNLFFWGRVTVSLGLLAFAFAVTLKALFDGNTLMWEGVPAAVSVIILFILMAFVGMMEGMQIALFAVVKMPSEELEHHKVAKANCELAFAGQNLQAFLIGRQICVTICMFVVARITAVAIPEGEPNIFGVSDALQGFFNTGLLGALITTIVGSLIWRIVASSFALAFLSNPLIYGIIRLCLLLEYSGVCSAAWILARFHKALAKYQPDEVYLEGAEKHTSEPVTSRDKDIDRLSMVFKFTYSLALLAFAVVLVMAAMFQKQTTGTANMGIPPAVAFFVFWFLIAWLGMMEGGQGALVALQSVDPTKYEQSHPRSLKNTQLAHKGDNMERFIVGRQFLVVLVVFVTNMMGAAVKDAQVLGLSDLITEIFMNSGLSLILVTIMIGQLTAQINAATCMLDFLNNYFMLFTTYTSLAIEFSGLLHSVYLVQIIFSKVAGQAIDTKEEPRNGMQNLFFWGRVTMSLAVLGFSFAVTLKALFDGNTTMWEGVPAGASVAIFFILMCFVGLMEGMQIALFAVVKMPSEELEHHKVAKANCELAFAGHNLQAFLIGRQILVTLCMFVVARITTLSISEGEPNIFGVSDGLQEFFNTGLLGALITTIVASLIWRIIASSFPLAFLSNPLIYLIIRICLVLEATGVCSAAWVLGRWNKLLVSYQPDEVYLEGAEKHTSEPVTRRDKDVDITVTVIKYVYSTALLIFSVTVVMATIFTEQTKISQQAHSAVAFLLIWGLILWLAMMEGGQGCLVGLQPVEKSLYMDSHPITLKSTTLAHKGDNMERFIVGRQFLVVLVVFTINMCGAALAGTEVLDLPSLATEIFVSSGVAMILMTIILGQLTAQVNAANCMLDFINTYFMVFTTWISLGIEYSGLLHSVYLVQMFFAKITGKEIDTAERSQLQKLFFWVRVLFSLAVLVFSFVVTLSALFAGQTAMWDGVPGGVSVVILFVLMGFVGMMEGMQIALFAVINMPEDEIKDSKLAKKTCELTFKGSNLQAFLIGRQILVTICMFVVARITSVTVAEGEENILGVSDGVQKFFNTGLLGAIITTLVGSLAWRIVASSFPVAFLSNPLIYAILRGCLLLEATGICSAAWLLAIIHRAIASYKVDEVYVGTAEERAANSGKKVDDTDLPSDAEIPA